MKKVIRGGVILLSGVILFTSCSAGGSRCEKWIKKTLDTCKENLSIGNWSNATDECLRVIDPEGECEVREVDLCEANYLLFLSNLFYHLDSASGLLSLSGELSGGMLTPSQNITLEDLINYIKFALEKEVNIDSFLFSIVQPIYLNLTKMEGYTDYVIKNNCSLKMDKIPLKIFKNFSISVPEVIELSGDMEFRGEWDSVEANIFSAFIDLTKGILDLLFSYDLNLNAEGLLNLLTGITGGNTSTVQLLRLSGGTFYKSDFLKWHKVRANLFTYADDEISSFFTKISTALETLFREQDKNPEDDIIFWFDKDKNSVLSGGDELCINLYSSGVDDLALASVCDLLKTLISQEFINTIIQLFSEIGECVKYDEKNEDCIISLADVTNTLTLNLLVFLDNIHLKPRKFFGEVDKRKPLREYLPFLYDPDDEGKLLPVFLIEGEVYPEAGTSWTSFPCSPQYSNGTTSYVCYYAVEGEKFEYPDPGTSRVHLFYRLEDDSPHFSIGFKWNNDDESVGEDGSIAKDCFTLPPELSSFEIFYFGMKDPTIGGALLVNPAVDEREFPGCPGTPDEFLSPTNFYFNRVLAYWQKKIYDLLRLAQEGF